MGFDMEKQMSFWKPQEWLAAGVGDDDSAVVVFRKRFTLPVSRTLAIRYSADPVASVFLDGEWVGCGPERGCPERWYYGVLRLDVPAGPHVLAFRVNCFAWPLRPHGQMSVKCGLAVEEESGVLGGEWEVRRLPARLVPSQTDWGCGPKIDLCDPDGVSYGRGEAGWSVASTRADGRLLEPPELPPMRHELYEDCHWDGEWLLCDRYGCFFADYVFSGTGTVSVRYFESRPAAVDVDIHEEGAWDSFEVAGARQTWHDLWFRSGKCACFHCTGTAKVERVRLFRTGYPYRFDWLLPADDERDQTLLDKAVHTLSCCSYQTFMDCPFYEQLQYAGDSRVECLVAYACNSDHRLMRKAVRTLFCGVHDDGAMPCRYPAKDTMELYRRSDNPQSLCLIPAYSFTVVQMLHDYALLREDDALVESLVPACRKILAWGERYLDEEGVLGRMPGWNFIDWLSNWKDGTPPGCREGGGCTLNWVFNQSLRHQADLEAHFGDAKRAAEYKRLAERHEAAIRRAFYVPERDAFAENREHTCFSEHAQVLAILTTGRPCAMALLREGKLDRCGIFFSFYYLAAMRACGETALFEQRLECYRRLADNPSLDTLPEEFANWRSYCHAWSAHALYFHVTARELLTELIPDEKEEIAARLFKGAHGTAAKDRQ